MSDYLEDRYFRWPSGLPDLADSPMRDLFESSGAGRLRLSATRILGVTKPVRVTPNGHDDLETEEGGEVDSRGCRRHIALRRSGPKTREDWLDALELVLGSRAEAERAYEVGTEALRFEEEVLREIAALPETAFDD